MTLTLCAKGCCPLSTDLCSQLTTGFIGEQILKRHHLLRCMQLCEQVGACMPCRVVAEIGIDQAAVVLQLFLWGGSCQLDNLVAVLPGMKVPAVHLQKSASQGNLGF